MKYPKPNKTEQIAKFLLLSAKPMSARQMYDAGFRFDVGDTTPTAINVLLGKMHVSSRYDLQGRESLLMDVQRRWCMYSPSTEGNVRMRSL